MENYKIKCQQIAVIFLFSCIIILFFKYNNRYYVDGVNAQIINKAAQELSICREDYFIDYISFKDSFFRKELRFIDQIKVIKNFSGEYEPVSVKFRNPNWGNSFIVDKDIYQLIKKGVSNPIYFDDLEELKKYKLVKDLINNSHESPQKAAFIATKKFTNIIYLFIVVNVNTHNKDCGENEFKEILNNMNDFVKQSFYQTL